MRPRGHQNSSYWYVSCSPKIPSDNNHWASVCYSKVTMPTTQQESLCQAKAHYLCVQRDKWRCHNASSLQNRIPIIVQWTGESEDQGSYNAMCWRRATLLLHPRKIPHPLLLKIKEELESMLHQGVISPVTMLTEWCSGLVPVPKPNGKVRICVDLTKLNKAVQREIHQMPSVDESLAKLGDSKIFSKLDSNSSFWQLPVDEDSKLLTTFVTPFGQLCFNRFPFGTRGCHNSLHSVL